MHLKLFSWHLLKNVCRILAYYNLTLQLFELTFLMQKIKKQEKFYGKMI